MNFQWDDSYRWLWSWRGTFSSLWMAGKGPVLHADECFFAICVLSERSQHSLLLIVRLFHCVHRARLEFQIVPGVITRRSVRDGVTLNRDTLIEFEQKGVRQSKKSRDVVDLSQMNWRATVWQTAWWQPVETKSIHSYANNLKVKPSVST